MDSAELLEFRQPPVIMEFTAADLADAKCAVPRLAQVMRVVCGPAGCLASA